MPFRTFALTYHTFSGELPAVHQALVDTLKRMGMRVLPGGSREDGVVRLHASAWRRELEVECEPKGIGKTQVRVFTKEDVYFQENIAAALVVQATRLIERRRLERIIGCATDHDTSAAILSVQRGPLAVAG
jgi:hypothetical protein